MISLGTGLIASWFVSDLLLDPSRHRKEESIRHVIQAIGSSSVEKGNTFWKKVGSVATLSAPSIYKSYSKVYNDPNVDIVYIATPHALHLVNALDAINNRKHVLCEKPITITAKDAKKLAAAAQEKGVFLMEGL